MEKNKKIIIIVSSILFVVLFAIISIILFYNSQLKAVNKNAEAEIFVEIPAGTNTDQILEILKEKEIIKNSFVAKIYIKLNKISGLQAGKYNFRQSMELKEILKTITSGDIINENVTITFLEGKNMRWNAKKIAESTSNKEEDVFKTLENEKYIKTLIDKYWFLTEEILDSDIYYPLEGYLYPETYHINNKDVGIEEIFETQLDQTDKILSKFKKEIAESGRTVHEILTLSSIVELEGKDSESRKGIASVIYNRLNNNMKIDCDVTTYYGIQVDMGERDLTVKELNRYNKYNTRAENMSGKLPIGPIAAVSEEAVQATLYPKNENYFYFVADINGKIHFTRTFEEHNKKITELKKEGLWYNY